MLSKEFLATNGKALDIKLRAKDSANLHTSFVSKPWSDMYLTDRRPLPIHSNPFKTWREHPKLELNTQDFRAAQICWASGKYFKTLEDGHLEPIVLNMKNKSYPLCMSQVTNLFYSTRIPQPNKDIIQKSDERANHVIVLFKVRTTTTKWDSFTKLFLGQILYS